MTLLISHYIVMISSMLLLSAFSNAFFITMPNLALIYRLRDITLGFFSNRKELVKQWIYVRSKVFLFKGKIFLSLFGLYLSEIHYSHSFDDNWSNHWNCILILLALYTDKSANTFTSGYYFKGMIYKWSQSSWKREIRLILFYFLQQSCVSIWIQRLILPVKIILIKYKLVSVR